LRQQTSFLLLRVQDAIPKCKQKKFRILTILTEFSPHFLKHDDEILARGGGPGTLSPAPNFVKIAQGDLSLGVNFFTKKFEIFAEAHISKPTMLKFCLRQQIHQRQKISSKSLKGPAGIALPRR